MSKPAPSALFPTISHPKKRAVLRAYVECGRVKPACAAAKTDFSMHYYWLKQDPVYAEAFAEAQGMVATQLEDEAIRRALGWEETHYTLQARSYDVTKHSDTLLIFLLKGAMPKKYGDKVTHTGKDGGPIDVRGLADLLTHARNGSHASD